MSGTGMHSAAKYWTLSFHFISMITLLNVYKRFFIKLMSRFL